MVGAYDTEQQRMVDRIKCIAFREARDMVFPIKLCQIELYGEFFSAIHCLSINVAPASQASRNAMHFILSIILCCSVS